MELSEHEHVAGQIGFGFEARAFYLLVFYNGMQHRVMPTTTTRAIRLPRPRPTARPAPRKPA